MTQKELKTAVENKEPRLYIFAGEEDYLKRHWLAELRKSFVEDPSLAAFNHLVYEGARLDLSLLSEALLSPPMMSDTKLVEWHLPNINALTQKDLEALHACAESIRSGGFAALALVVQPEDFDLGILPKKPSKMYTALSKIADIIVFDQAADHQLSSWIARRFAAEELRILPAVSEELLSVSGHSMDTLVGEIRKLAAFVKSQGRSEVMPSDIHAVASKTSESDAFGLSNAILSGNRDAALRALSDMRMRQLQPTQILSSVASVYADLYRVAFMSEESMTPAEIAKQLRMHEYKAGLYLKAVRGIPSDKLLSVVAAAREADVNMKSGGQTGYAVVERLLIFALGVTKS